MSYELLTGDCRDVLTGMPADSVDAVVTDPPYALTGASRNGSPRQNDPATPFGRTGLGGDRGFMGQTWDVGAVAFDPATWAAVLRVARPGAWLLAFGGTRTWHRLVCAIEDGGWRISDQIASFGAAETVGPLAWVTGQGFPKGKSSLKPAWEPVCVARKPAARVAPLNIEACRVGTTVETWPVSRSYAPGQMQPGGKGTTVATGEAPAGRYPPNLLLTHDERCVPSGVRRVKAAGWRDSDKRHTADGWRFAGNGSDEGQQHYADPDGYETVADTSGCVEGCPVRRLDEQAGERPSGARRGGILETPGPFTHGSLQTIRGHGFDASTGGASRFFPTFRYEPKAPPSERTLPDGTRCPHPTVKPEKLVSWLCALVARPGMTILDPFMGSGTTGVCASRMGCRFIGIEQSPEYADYARRRLDAVRPTLDTAQEETA